MIESGFPIPTGSRTLDQSVPLALTDGLTPARGWAPWRERIAPPGSRLFGAVKLTRPSVLPG